MNNTLLPYLQTLCRLIDPNLDGSISMHDVGAEMGLNREESTQTAQELMADGLVDVRTLAGAIGITAEGLALLETATDSAPSDAVTLGTDGIISPAAKDELQQIMAQTRTALEEWDLTADDRAEVLADLETIEAQMASPKPKNTILHAAVESLHTLLINSDQDDPRIKRWVRLLG